MLREKILKRLCFAIVLLFVLNQAATFFSWYSLAWWFDMPMHFLGGVSVLYLSAILWLPARKWVPDGRFIFECLITAVLFGVLWEALELFLFVHYGTPTFVLRDAISDLFFDLAGALYAARILTRYLGV
jgi:hypothetical protein